MAMKASQNVGRAIRDPRLRERAAACGIETEYIDGLGRRRGADPQIVSRLLQAIDGETQSRACRVPHTVVVRGAHNPRIDFALPDGGRLRWQIFTEQEQETAAGSATAPAFALPRHLPKGVLRLRVAPDRDASEEALLIVCPQRCFQGAASADARLWGIAVQLYGVRSSRNWGHGDFTDLLSLVDHAADLGASAIGLNPLHALFDDRPTEPSPYFPSSRLFLNPLYIDLEAVPEFPGTKQTGLNETVAKLRSTNMIAYSAIAAAKLGALKCAYQNFRASGTPDRRDAFERFRQERGAILAKFASFEFLRRKLGVPWPEWPPLWRRPDGGAIAELRQSREGELGYFEFVQWLAHEQLERCRALAHDRGLSIGLYLDVAVGVRPDGFDAWLDQEALVPGMRIGAPPDLLNRLGQDWGLAAFNPAALQEQGFAPYRRLLQASMRYAGAIRLDHVLGLNRLFLVPAGASPAHGLYVRYPLKALLAVTALASVETACIVIGEDLGTVPKGFRETMMDWGLWGYQVMLFERSRRGEFLRASRYRKEALVTFTTHDLPTFRGWWEMCDLVERQALGLEVGDTRRRRQSARQALRRVLRMSAGAPADFAAVAKYLARTPSRLLMLSMEDLLGVAEQINIPGTVEGYPNWRRRLPVTLEELIGHERVRAVAAEMRRAGRSPAAQPLVCQADKLSP